MAVPPFPRLSRRQNGVIEEEELYEGIPPHLLTPLRTWATRHLGCSARGESSVERQYGLERLAVECRLEVESPNQYLSVMVNLAHDQYDQAEEFLKVLDMHLMLFGYGHDVLAAMLRRGGSAWMVAEAPLRLERRVPDEEREQYTQATAEGDAAAQQLREAWGKVYGRNPDPSDAWDHAIKAVEFLLHRLVLPKNDKATLGSMSGALPAERGCGARSAA